MELYSLFDIYITVYFTKPVSKYTTTTEILCYNTRALQGRIQGGGGHVTPPLIF